MEKISRAKIAELIDTAEASFNETGVYSILHFKNILDAIGLSEYPIYPGANPSTVATAIQMRIAKLQLQSMFF